jgi:hypothetical protein
MPNIVAGADFEKYRPLVHVIETISPHTNKPTWNNWEPRLLASSLQKSKFAPNFFKILLLMIV